MANEEKFSKLSDNELEGVSGGGDETRWEGLLDISDRGEYPRFTMLPCPECHMLAPWGDICGACGYDTSRDYESLHR
jgi:bacteriocin-like protein